MNAALFTLMAALAGVDVMAAPANRRAHNATGIEERQFSLFVPSVIPAGTVYNGYTSRGCWQDTLVHILPFAYSESTMSIDKCLATCNTRGMAYAGVENGRNCYCGSAVGGLGLGGLSVLNTFCSMTCPGNNQQNCGGLLYMVLFEDRTKLAAASSSVAAYSASTAAAAQQSLAAYSASTAAAAQQSLAAYSASTAAAATQQSLAAYSASVAAVAAEQSAAAQAASVAAAAARESVAAYSASVAAVAVQESVVAHSASVAAAAARESAAAYSADVAAVVAQESAAAYSASVAAAAARESAVAYSAGVAAAAESAAAYSASAAAATARESDAAYSTSAAAAAASQSAANAQASASAHSANVAIAAASESAALASASEAAYSASSSAAAYSASSSAAAYSSSVSAAAAQSTSAPSGWSFASTACLAEGTSGRALVGGFTAGPDMTYEKCTSYCASQGYGLAGLEYSAECFCANYLENGASLSKASSQCNMKASGNSAQIAGGPNAITLFIADSFDKTKVNDDLTQKTPTAIETPLPSGWSAVSGPGICVQEGTSGRALAGAFTAADDMIIAKCISFCSGKGMQYAGLEYGRECFCGNDFVHGASLSRTGPCQMQCVGAPGTVCGGPNLLSVYHNDAYGYTKSQAGDFKRQGCIQEVAGRALTGAMIATEDMTIEKCTTYCGAAGFSFAGLEYARECFCGNTLVNGASLSSFSTQCKMPCTGNNAQNCGGPNAINLWATESGLARVGA